MPQLITPSETATRFNELVEGFFPSKPQPIFTSREPEKPQYWDFASTGSICNLSPFLGYLWLMARRETTSGSDPKIFVPKIASGGTAGGTIDTLTAGGYTFQSDRDIVRGLVHDFGGYFFRQSDDLTGYDKPLMGARRSLNLMASGELVLASILAKKLAIGTTHVVIDVKLGADTKMFPRLGRIPMPDGLRADQIANEASTVGNSRGSEIFVSANQVPTLARWLAALLGGSWEDTGHFVDVTWQAPWDRTIEVRLIFSNADTPQCRAVGRLLGLHQLDVIAGDPPYELPPAMRDWYLRHIPNSVGVASENAGDLAQSWQSLKLMLPALANAPEYRYLCDVIAAKGGNDQISPRQGLASMTLKACDVPKWANAEVWGRRIDRMYAYPLDTPLFQSVQQHQHTDDDPAIGFWLHRLPGEVVDENDAIVTAFFRPSDGDGELRRSLIRYLSEHVTFSR